MEVPHCHYCGKQTQDRKDFYIYTLYQVISVKSFPVGYKYSSRDIYVPRCRSCKSKHNKFGTIVIFPTIIISFIASSLLLRYKADFDWLGALALSGLISFVFSAIVISILYDLLFKRIYPKIKMETDVADYPSIKTLIDLGWLEGKPDPASVSEDDIAKDSPYYKGENRYNI